MNVASVAPGATVRNGFMDPAYLAAVGVPHLGVDLAVAVGTPVYAPASGVVIFAGLDDASGDGGIGVKVATDDGAEVGVWHLSAASAAVGARVRAGDQLGLSGQSGNALYPHVHLQLERPRGNPVDPLPWLASLGADVAPAAPNGAPSGAGVRWGRVLVVGGLALLALAIVDD